MKIALMLASLFFLTNSYSNESQVYLFGEIKKIEHLKYNYSSESNMLVISELCGKYKAEIIVKDVIYGKMEESNIIIEGDLDHLCRGPKLYSKFIFGIDKNNDVFFKKKIYAVESIKNPDYDSLFDTFYAALPSFDVRKDMIMELTFHDYVEPIYPTIFKHKEFTVHHDKKWFKKTIDNGYKFYEYKSGVLYDDLKEFMIKRLEKGLRPYFTGRYKDNPKIKEKNKN